MDIRYPVHLLNIILPLTVVTGAAFPLVRANWLRDGGIERLREDRNTAITDKGGGGEVSVSDV